MLSGKGKPQAAAGVKDDDGSDMVRMDAASSGGLGGTTEEVFGPLVSVGHDHYQQCCAPFAAAYAWSIRAV